MSASFLNHLAGSVLIFLHASVFPVADSFIFLEFVLAYSIVKPVIFLLVTM